MALQLVQRPDDQDGGRVWQVVDDRGHLVAYITEWANGFHCRPIEHRPSGPYLSAEAALDSLQ